MVQSDKHPFLLLDLASGERPDSPRLTLEKTSCSKSAAEIARHKNRGYLRDTVVKISRRLYNEFLPTKRSIVQENRVRRAHEVPPSGRALHPGGSLVSLPDYFLFSYFLKYSKTEKIAIRTILESVYLPYHIPIPFWSLKRSGKCPLCAPPVLRCQLYWSQHLWDYLRYNV